MQPRSFDDVLLAYEQAVKTLRSKQDHLRDAATEVSRTQVEIEAQIKLVRELRDEVRTYGHEVAA